MLTLVAIKPGDPAPVPDAAEVARPLTASQILLAAAERSSRETSGTGKYLVVRTESASVITVGSGASAYEMTQKSSYESWLSRSGKQRNWLVFQDLGMTPTTPADAAAWRAAGSPKQVMVGKPLPNGELGPGSPVSIAAGPRRSGPSEPADLYAIGVRNVSVRDLEKLPVDPAALRAELLQQFDGGGGDLPVDRDEWLLTVASGLITEIPVNGAVRSAAFRLIATLPGVRSLGDVTDQRGRPGQGFAYPTQGGTIERRFMIDVASGRALGEETRVLRSEGRTARREPGSLLGWSVVLEQKITDETPPK